MNERGLTTKDVSVDVLGIIPREVGIILVELSEGRANASTRNKLGQHFWECGLPWQESMSLPTRVLTPTCRIFCKLGLGMMSWWIDLENEVDRRGECMSSFDI